MGLTFCQLNNKKDDGKCTASSVPLITKWTGLLRTKYPPWACPSAMPDGHGLVEADFPRGKEDGSHVVIPFIYHLANLPKLINIRWGIIVSEPKFTGDGVKAEFRHELPHTIGAWICLLIKGDNNPKILPLPSRAGGH